LIGGFELVEVGHADDGGLAAENALRHRGYPLDDPSLTEIVIRYEDAAWLEHALNVLKRLLREQIAFEADIRIAAVQDQRIHQGIDGEIIFALGRSQEMPAVIDVSRHARVLIGMVRIPVDADTLNDRIDLDGIDVANSEVKRVIDVVAGARADDQLLLERRTSGALL